MAYNFWLFFKKGKPPLKNEHLLLLDTFVRAKIKKDKPKRFLCSFSHSTVIYRPTYCMQGIALSIIGTHWNLKKFLISDCSQVLE